MSEIELKNCPNPECKDIDMEIYCTKCGACGIEGCCPLDKCKCLHGEEYNETYKELLDENKILQTKITKQQALIERMAMSYQHLLLETSCALTAQDFIKYKEALNEYQQAIKEEV